MTYWSSREVKLVRVEMTGHGEYERGYGTNILFSTLWKCGTTQNEYRQVTQLAPIPCLIINDTAPLHIHYKLYSPLFSHQGWVQGMPSLWGGGRVLVVGVVVVVWMILALSHSATDNQKSWNKRHTSRRCRWWGLKLEDEGTPSSTRKLLDSFTSVTCKYT